MKIQVLNLGLISTSKENCARKIVCIKRLFTPKTTNIGKHLSTSATLFQNLLGKLTNYQSYDVIGISLTDNPKKFWSYVRNSKSENLSILPLKNSDSSVCLTDKNKAESLDSYFHSILTQEQMPVPNIGIPSFSSISHLKTSPPGVFKQLNPKKGCGPDEIPAGVLKEVSQSVLCWLSFIFQQS